MGTITDAAGANQTSRIPFPRHVSPTGLTSGKKATDLRQQRPPTSDNLVGNNATAVRASPTSGISENTTMRSQVSPRRHQAATVSAPRTPMNPGPKTVPSSKSSPPPKSSPLTASQRKRWSLVYDYSIIPKFYFDAH